MAEQDSLSNFDFNRVSKPGKFLKFEAGKPVTVRVLTKDPIVQERVYEGDGETRIDTKFCFIVWNFTHERAQIMTVGPSIAKTLQSIANDEDFGSNLQQCDIKISPEGEKLKRTYTVNVIRHSGNEKQLTAKMVEEARALNLDEDITDGNRGRLSEYNPEGVQPNKSVKQGSDIDQTPKYDNNDQSQRVPDQVFEDIGDEPINLDDIPF